MQLNLIFPIVKKILRMSFAGVATQNDSKTASKVVDENGQTLVVYHTRDAYKG